MIRRLLVLVTLLACGCGTRLIDPCAGQSGACLAIHIDSSPTVNRLGGAIVHVTGDGIDTQRTVGLVGGASTTSLPVALAVVLPGLTMATAIHVDVIGTNASVEVGEGQIDTTLSPNQHEALHVQLRGLTGGDDGGTDVDMSSTDLAGYVPLTVQLAGSGSGTVTGSGVACAGTTCSGLYPPHALVTLTAAPAVNASFAGWSGGGCSGTSTCSVTLDSAATITATFDWKLVPSHVPASALRSDAANLSAVTAIDTHNLTINGAAPPAGITFAFSSGIAVLSVAQWNIDKGIQVTGDAPLVVLASGAVVMAPTAAIDASAHNQTPGPGGNALCSNPGAGSNMTMAGTGGGGGGNFGGGASDSFGPAGATYGPALTDFCGGAPGAGGAHINVTDVTCNGTGLAGSGGGAIQISSAVSITLHGSIIAAGGGGIGGCGHANTPPVMGYSRADGGGGGAGGEIFLEAPSIVVDGGAGGRGLFANGGGGGAPNPGTGNGPNGGDGVPSNMAAVAGTISSTQHGGEGAYSADGAMLTAATAPDGSNSGGGGGGVGRIWLRTRQTPAATTGATLSPAPMTDKTL